MFTPIAGRFAIVLTRGAYGDMSARDRVQIAIPVLLSSAPMGPTAGWRIGMRIRPRYGTRADSNFHRERYQPQRPARSFLGRSASASTSWRLGRSDMKVTGSATSYVL